MRKREREKGRPFPSSAQLYVPLRSCRCIPFFVLCPRRETSERAGEEKKKGKESASIKACSAIPLLKNGALWLTASSVPKFGGWNENDPSSAAGYTVVFEKVRTEKKAPNATLSHITSRRGGRIRGVISTPICRECR
ncbi:unnamed protein product [Spirodela intermedia]|uniref:RIN4 pathogenic type III effector avirulence factor Avr cleavage site domain-containing protein n=1 Tax=Spirodela intermedia TaxID=51605 RepID=A0A7I8J1I1_SPIIN|nr:unnamed protein product [Spirodela intermedia]CAA6664075.1 unnamed protein product [Spirodela intermedia]